MRSRSNIFRISLSLILLLVFASCKKEDEGTIAKIPEIKTISVTSITQNSGISGGIFLTDGGSTVTEKGICWSTDTMPTIAANKYACGTDTGRFVCQITGLQPNTTYCVCSYAINEIGTAYGNKVYFTTPGGSTGTVTDIDGNVYPTIQIGKQTWMTENLRTKRFRNGDQIPFITTFNTGNGTWRSLASAAYCFFSYNDVIITELYGNLYNWFAVNDSRNIAPSGWHVATNDEWQTLIKNLGGSGIAGGKLKESGSGHWLSPNTGASDSYGFKALPGGERQSFDGAMVSNSYSGWWWSSTPDGTLKARAVSLHFDSNKVLNWQPEKVSGLSVRCVKDL